MWGIIRPVSSYLPSSLIASPPPHTHTRSEHKAGLEVSYPFLTLALHHPLYQEQGGVKEELEKHNDIVMPAMYGDRFASR